MRPVRSLGLALIPVVLGACVWRSSDPPPTPSEPALVDGYEQVAPGVTRKIEVGADGEEHVRIHVDVDQAEDLSGGEPPAILARPFDAERIRQGMAVGTELVFGMSGERTGEATVTWRVTGSDDDTVEITYVAVPADGQAQPPETQTLPWKQLEEHASFPEAFSTRTAGPVQVQAGTFEGWVYTVTPPDAQPPVVERFHFAKDLPGPPVLHEITQEGTVVHRMELLSHSAVPAVAP